MAYENATPRLWYILGEDEIAGIEHVEISSGHFGPGYRSVAWVGNRSDALDEQARADAALIVEAVNAYDTLRAERDALREEVETLTLATDLGSSAIEALTEERNDLLSAIRAVSDADDIGSMHAAFRICRRLIDKSEAQS